MNSKKKPRILFTGTSRDQVIRLGREASYKLTTVLRMRPDDLVLVVDGKGGERLCRIETTERDEVVCRILEEVTRFRSRPRIRLFPALMKQSAFELLIEKGVELGVDIFQPIITSRTVFQGKVEKKKRWERIIENAFLQSEQAVLAEISDPIPFLKIPDLCEDAGIHIVLDSHGKPGTIGSIGKIIDTSLEKSAGIDIFVGPEGGFSRKEIDELKHLGGYPLTIAERILKCETAVLYILSILDFLYAKRCEVGPDGRKNKEDCDRPG